MNLVDGEHLASDRHLDVHLARTVALEVGGRACHLCLAASMGTAMRGMGGGKQSEAREKRWGTHEEIMQGDHSWLRYSI